MDTNTQVKEYYVLRWRLELTEEIWIQELGSSKLGKYITEFVKFNERCKFSAPENRHFVVDIVLVSGQIPI